MFASKIHPVSTVIVNRIVLDYYLDGRVLLSKALSRDRLPEEI